MIDLLDALDLSTLPSDQREYAGIQVASLLRPLHEMRLVLMVSNDFDELENFKVSTGAETLRLFSSRWDRASTKADTIVLICLHGTAVISTLASRIIWVEPSLADVLPSLGYDNEHWTIDCPTASALSCVPVAMQSGAETLGNWRERGIMRSMFQLMNLLLATSPRLDRWHSRAALIRAKKVGLTFTSSYGYDVAAGGIVRRTMREPDGIHYRLGVKSRLRTMTDFGIVPHALVQSAPTARSYQRGSEPFEGDV